jgi:hypothetical protein
MTPERASLVTAFLQRSEAVYATSPNDFAGKANTLFTYFQEVNQWKYVHMYFAKYVGCWRWVRRWLQYPVDGDVFSVGAGPCLCLMGWFFDTQQTDGQNVRALDILPWSAIQNETTFRALIRHVLNGAKGKYDSNVYFPPGSPPPQSRGIQTGPLSYLDPTYFPREGTVLVPFVLNHLIGLNSPHPQPGEVFKWLEAVRRRVKRIVVVDMQHDGSTAEFWSRISAGLGLAPQCHVFEFPELVREFAPCYSSPNYANRRTGGLSSLMYQASGVLGTPEGWRYIF